MPLPSSRSVRYAAPPKRNLNDWLRGGAYTREPSEHNAMLYRRERTPMLRWRLVALFNLVFWLGLLGPFQLLIAGLREGPGDWWAAVRTNWQTLRTGRLYGA